MARFLSGLSLLLLCCSAYAEIAAANAPEETASPLAVIIFVVIFVAFCVGFMWMVYSNDKKTKRRNAEGHDASGKTT